MRAPIQCVINPETAQGGERTLKSEGGETGLPNPLKKSQQLAFYTWELYLAKLWMQVDASRQPGSGQSR